MGASRAFFFSFFVLMMGLVDLERFFFVLACFFVGCRRSIRARRRTKGMTNFSHGRRRMTRSCSSTVRLLSTLLLGIHHMVRVRVSLSDHNRRVLHFPPSPFSLRFRFPPSSNSPLFFLPPVSFDPVFNPACHTTTAGQKLCSRLLTTLLRPLHDT